MGSDYMKIPLEKDRKPKHRGIYNAFITYKIFNKKFTDFFEKENNEKTVVFGSGMMFDDYMKKYGKKHLPEFIVDNDKNKWGKIHYGIEIKNPSVLKELDLSRTKIIICSFYYKEIERQLIAAGIHKYKIYIQEKKWILDAEEDEY